MSNEYTINRLSSIKEVSRNDWNALTDVSNPFVRHEYLSGLEEFDCLDNHGWIPYHLVIFSGNLMVGALPLYLRSNSYGEFVFDWAWADAYEKAGGKYYPKLVSAIPFAPVIGPRVLTNQNQREAKIITRMLIQHVLQIIKVNGLSSVHFLFNNDPGDIYLENKLLQRHTIQYHWKNKGYRDFDDFLDTLTSKKRKQIRRERNKISTEKLQIDLLNGNEMDDDKWDIYYDFYCSTFYKRWGNPRLTKSFFKSISVSMPDQTLVILARLGSEYVAGSFLMIGANTLYGRHWGCLSQLPYLHFELCYYQPIEYCIKNNINTLDAGVQGEHKLARGFEPILAESYHWIENSQFRSAISKYLMHETSEINIYLQELKSHLPYKTTSLS